ADLQKRAAGMVVGAGRHSFLLRWLHLLTQAPGDDNDDACRIVRYNHARNTPMAKAHVDPADLRKFAQDLNRFNNELQTLLGGLHAKMRALENTWRDQEQRKFT